MRDFIDSINLKFYTTTTIMKEIKHILNTSLTLDLLISSGVLVIQDPLMESAE